MLRLAPRAGSFGRSYLARVGDYPNSLVRLITPGGRASAPAQPFGGAPAQPRRGCSAQRSRRVFLPAAGSPPSGPLFQGSTELPRAWQALPGFSVLQLPLGLCGASGPPGPGLCREFLSLSLCPCVAATVTLCPGHPPARLGLAVPSWQRLQDGAGEGRPFPPLHGTPRPSVGTVLCPLWECQAWSWRDLGCG